MTTAINANKIDLPLRKPLLREGRGGRLFGGTAIDLLAFDEFARWCLQRTKNTYMLREEADVEFDGRSGISFLTEVLGRMKVYMYTQCDRDQSKARVNTIGL